MSVEQLVKLANEHRNSKQKALTGFAATAAGGSIATLAADSKLKDNLIKANRAKNRALSYQTYPTKHWVRKFEDAIGAKRGINLTRKHDAKVAKLAANSKRLSLLRKAGIAGTVAGYAGLGALGAHSLYKKVTKGA